VFVFLLKRLQLVLQHFLLLLKSVYLFMQVNESMLLIYLDVTV